MDEMESIDKFQKTGYDILLLGPKVVVCDKLTDCVAVVNAPIPSSVDYFVKFIAESKTTFVRATRISDAALTFIAPTNFPPGPTKVTIHHGDNHNLLCTYEGYFTFQSKLDAIQELLQTESDPMTFLASVYGLENFDQDTAMAVDLKMEKILNQSKPLQFSLVADKCIQDLQKVSFCKTPTLLHMAARYNLIRLSISLMDCPGSSQALNLRNVDGDCPHQLASRFKNNDLAKLLRDAKHRSQDSTDEDIYEPMSTDLSERYKEVNRSFLIYESMNESGDEIYEPMFSSRCNSASSHKGSIDQQSISSSDSGSYVETKSLSGRPSLPENVPPPLPPQDYTRSALKNTNTKSGTTTAPPRPPILPKTRPVKERPSLPSPPNCRKTPPLPPPTQLLIRSNTSSSNSTPSPSNEIYDVPPPSSKQTSEEDVYDVPPPKLNLTLNEDMYDVLPPKPVPTPSNADNGNVENDDDNEDGIYDVPPPARASENGLYVPAHEMERLSKIDTDDTYDTLPTPRPLESSEAEGFETYDVPTKATSTEELYEVPDTKRDYQSELQDKLGSFKPLSNSSQDLTQTNGRPPRMELGRIGKRMSEPAISPFSPRHDQQQQSMFGNTPRSQIPLPLPPRNSNVQFNRTPAPAKRGKDVSTPPPPIPPQRKPIR